MLKHGMKTLSPNLNLPGPGKISKKSHCSEPPARTALGDIAFKEDRLTDAASLYNAAANGPRPKTGGRIYFGAAQRRTRPHFLAAVIAGVLGERMESCSVTMHLPAYQSAIKTIEKPFAQDLYELTKRVRLFLASTKDVYDEAGAPAG